MKEDPVFLITRPDNLGINYPSYLLFAQIIEDQLCVVSFHSGVLANIFVVQIVLGYGSVTYAACLILYL